MKLTSHGISKPWGRDDIPAVFAATPGSRTGEVWYDHPAKRLPLLIKWLFTSERLSIQVHPDDQAARQRGLASGKEECWVVISAEPGAALGIGTRKPLNGEALRRAALSGDIVELMEWHPVKPGEFYFIPAGTVHAIGAGVSLVEVQQNADVTYRLFDYGRPRTLHLDDGIAVARAEPYTDPRCGTLDAAGSDQLLLNSHHFELRYVRPAGLSAREAIRQPTWIVPLAGTVHASGDVAKCGECLYLEDNAELHPSVDFEGLWATCR